MEASDDRNQPAASPTADWPTLAAKLIDDLSRMMHAEIRLAELGLKNIIQSQVDQILATLVIAGLLVCAVACIVAANVLLLHHWMQWWQAFALTALVATAIAFIVRSLARRPSDPAPADV